MTIRDDFRNCIILGEKICYTKLNFGLQKVDNDIGAMTSGLEKMM